MSHRRVNRRKGRSPLRARLASRRTAEAKPATVHSVPARKEWGVLSWFNEAAKPKSPRDYAQHGEVVLASPRSFSRSTSSEEGSDVVVSSDSHETGSDESTSGESTSILVSSASSTTSASSDKAERWVPAQAHPRTDSKGDTSSSEAPRKPIKKDPRAQKLRALAQQGVDTLGAAPDKAREAAQNAKKKFSKEEIARMKQRRQERERQKREVEKVIGACIGTNEERRRVVRAELVLAFLQRVKNDLPLVTDTNALKVMHAELSKWTTHLRLPDYAAGLLACREALAQSTKAIDYLPTSDWLPTQDLKEDFNTFGGGQTPAKWLDQLIVLRKKLDVCQDYRDKELPTTFLEERFEKQRADSKIPQSLLDTYSTKELLAARSYVLAWEMVESKISKTIFPSYVGKEKALPQRESDSDSSYEG